MSHGHVSGRCLERAGWQSELYLQEGGYWVMCLLKVPGAGRLAVRAVFLRLFLTIQTRPLCFMLPQRRGTEPQSILSSRSGCVSRYSQACRMQVAGGGALISVCLPFSTKPRVSRIVAATCLVSTSPPPPIHALVVFLLTQLAPSSRPVSVGHPTPWPMPTHKGLVCLLLCNSWAALAFVCVS